MSQLPAFGSYCPVPARSKTPGGLGSLGPCDHFRLLHRRAGKLSLELSLPGLALRSSLSAGKAQSLVYPTGGCGRSVTEELI